MAAFAAQHKAEEHARVITGYVDQRHSPTPRADANDDGGRDGFGDWRLNVLRSLDSQHLQSQRRQTYVVL